MGISQVRCSAWLLFVLLAVFLSAGCSDESDEGTTGTAGGGGQAAALRVVDAHSQLLSGVQNTLDLDDIPLRMAEQNVTSTSLVALGTLAESLAVGDFAADNPDKIMALASLKVTMPDGEEAEGAELVAELQKQIDSGKFDAIGEMLNYHAAKDKNGIEVAPEIREDLDTSTTRAIVDKCVDQKWPVVLHIEFQSLENDYDANERNDFMDDLVDLLNDYPGHPFILAHVGELTPGECRELIENHGNLYFFHNFRDLAVLCTEVPVENYNEAQWMELFEDESERFIFALERVWAEHWQADVYAADMDYIYGKLALLPSEAAENMAYKNAEAMWNIKTP